MPTSKSTSTAEVFLSVHQFDFQPLPIRIIGSGSQTVTRPVPKRIKSSKLAPLKEGEEPKEGKKTGQALLRRRPSGEVSAMSQTSSQMMGTGTINAPGINTLKKTHIRTSYPKLMAKRTQIEEEESKVMDPAKVAER